MLLHLQWFDYELPRVFICFECQVPALHVLNDI